MIPTTFTYCPTQPDDTDNIHLQSTQPDDTDNIHLQSNTTRRYRQQSLTVQHNLATPTIFTYSQHNQTIPTTFTYSPTQPDDTGNIHLQSNTTQYTKNIYNNSPVQPWDTEDIYSQSSTYTKDS